MYYNYLDINNNTHIVSRNNNYYDVVSYVQLQAMDLRNDQDLMFA